ncbi:unnamed protein product [Amoebophrya sp. A120]|nr:unnamed protein product [Amoebophrya sp. A120]|eukprot:GSA120T00004824001.1
MLPIFLLNLEIFQILFAALLLLNVARTYRPLTQFYDWFASSGLEIANHRGYGQTACKFYLVFSSPFLSPAAHRAAGVAWMLGLLALACLNAYDLASPSAAGGAPTLMTNIPAHEHYDDVAVPLFAAALWLLVMLCYHLYMSQLYCEAHVGAHVTMTIPPTIVHCFFYNCSKAHCLVAFAAKNSTIPQTTTTTPADDSIYSVALSEMRAENVGEEDVQNNRKILTLSVVFAFLIKSNLLLAYCCAGFSKLKTSVKRGRSWMDGSTLQACIFEALSLSKNAAIRANMPVAPARVDELQEREINSEDGATTRNETSRRLNTPGNTTTCCNVPNYTFGVPTPFSDRLQEWILDKVLLLRLASVISVWFEFLAPLILLPNFFFWVIDVSTSPLLLPEDEPSQSSPALPHEEMTTEVPVLLLLNYGFFVCGLLFHYGIALLQNVDFVSWWAPVYFILLTDPALRLYYATTELGAPFPHIFDAIVAALQISPVFTSLSLLYFLTHVIAAACIQSGYLHPGNEYLPYSGYAMFSEIKDLFDGAYRKAFWLTEKEHLTGTLKNYCFPLLGRRPIVTEEEVLRLPFRYMVVAHNGLKPREQAPLPREIEAGSLAPAQEIKLNDTSKPRPNDHFSQNYYLSGDTSVSKSNGLRSLHSGFGDAASARFDDRGSCLKEKLLLRTSPTAREAFLEPSTVDDLVAEPLRVVTNVELTPEMEVLLAKINLLGCLGKDKFRDAKNVRQLLRLFEQLRHHFLRADRKSRLGTKARNNRV